MGCGCVGGVRRGLPETDRLEGCTVDHPGRNLGCFVEVAQASYDAFLESLPRLQGQTQRPHCTRMKALKRDSRSMAQFS